MAGPVRSNIVGHCAVDDRPETARLGVQILNTCTPYQVGNVPTRGEHCAWMESSAVVYCNSVLGARTAYVGQETYLFPLSVRDNLLFGLKQRPVAPAVR